MDRRDLRLVLGLAALSSALLLALAAGALEPALMYGAPFALLVLPLLAGRFVGEDALERLVARRASGSARRAPERELTRLPVAPFVALRGSLLLAASLAKRPPPVSALAR